MSSVRDLIKEWQWRRQPTPGEPTATTTELLRDLSEQSTRLIHQEIALARAELTHPRAATRGSGPDYSAPRASLALRARRAHRRRNPAALQRDEGVDRGRDRRRRHPRRGRGRSGNGRGPPGPSRAALPEAAIETAKQDVEAIRPSIREGRSWAAARALSRGAAKEIDATRRELGATVEQLAAKTAVRARLRDRVERVKDDFTHTREQITDRGQQLASNVHWGNLRHCEGRGGSGQGESRATSDGSGRDRRRGRPARDQLGSCRGPHTDSRTAKGCHGTYSGRGAISVAEAGGRTALARRRV